LAEFDHETAVHLDDPDRQLVQVRQRRVAGTEVVQRNADAAVVELSQRADRRRRVTHEHRLGDFQFEVIRAQAVTGDDLGHGRWQVRRP
jgi:hypothetical protein